MIWQNRDLDIGITKNHVVSICSNIEAFAKVLKMSECIGACGVNVFWQIQTR